VLGYGDVVCCLIFFEGALPCAFVWVPSCCRVCGGHSSPTEDYIKKWMAEYRAKYGADVAFEAPQVHELEAKGKVDRMWPEEV